MLKLNWYNNFIFIFLNYNKNNCQLTIESTFKDQYLCTIDLYDLCVNQFSRPKYRWNIAHPTLNNNQSINRIIFFSQFIEI